MIRRCEEHGYVDGERCPVCGARGDPVLPDDRRVELSKFCSGALRHFPEGAGIELDESGWTAFEDLVAAARDRYDWADSEAVAAVVATDPQGRFERSADGGSADPSTDADGGRIRAAYGHSVDVDLEPTDEPIPDRLYHGTAPGNIDSIQRAGLRPVGRQQVHLSGSVDRAREVGRRHADDPAVLVIDAVRLQAEGHDVSRRGESVYTTDRVPPDHLAVLYEGDREDSLLDATLDPDLEEG